MIGVAAQKVHIGAMTDEPMTSRATPRRSWRAALTALALVLAAPPLEAAAEEAVLVELFTSQGCSSCPPADALLGKLADLDGVVALSFHVEYWDYLGWRDTFARTAFTKRQYAYRDAWGERVVYTPQMVIGGDKGVVGSRRSEVDAALEAEEAETARSSGRLAIETGEGSVRAQLEDLPPTAEVWSAVYIQAATVAVERGENRGRTLTYHNVVRDLMRLGTVADAGASIAIPQPAPGEGVAVWVQERGLGAVHAAASHEISLSTAAIR